MMYLGIDHYRSLRIDDPQIYEDEQMLLFDRVRNSSRQVRLLPPIDDNTQFWQLEVFGGQVAFKNIFGFYLHRSGTNVLANASTPIVEALWTPELLPNGKYHLTSNINGYLARNLDIFLLNNTNIYDLDGANPNTQWQIVYNANSPYPTNFTRPASYLVPGGVMITNVNQKVLMTCNPCKYKEDKNMAITGQRYKLFKWQLEVVGDKIALKARGGHYLTRIAVPISTFFSREIYYTNSSTLIPAALFTPEYLFNGAYALKNDKGQYLTKTKFPGNLTVYITSRAGPLDSNAQWRITYIAPIKANVMPRAGSVKFMFDSKVAMMDNGYSTPSHVPMMLNGDSVEYRWTMEIVGSNVTIKSQSGPKYLMKALPVTSPSGQINQAYVFTNGTSTDIRSQWIPVLNLNGKWSFQAYNGKFLTACLQCTDTEVTASSNLHSDPSTQFNILYV